MSNSLYCISLGSTTKFEGVGSKGISNVIQTNFQAIASDININPVFLRVHCFYKIDKGMTNIGVNFGYVSKSFNILIMLMKKLLSKIILMESTDIQHPFLQLSSQNENATVN